jgi:hypothetical protein
MCFLFFGLLFCGAIISWTTRVPGGTGETTDKLSQDTRRPDRVSNGAPPKYESRVLQFGAESS